MNISSSCPSVSGGVAVSFTTPAMPATFWRNSEYRRQSLQWFLFSENILDSSSSSGSTERSSLQIWPQILILLGNSFARNWLILNTSFFFIKWSPGFIQLCVYSKLRPISGDRDELIFICHIPTYDEEAILVIPMHPGTASSVICCEDISSWIVTVGHITVIKWRMHRLTLREQGPITQHGELIGGCLCVVTEPYSHCSHRDMVGQFVWLECCHGQLSTFYLCTTVQKVLATLTSLVTYLEVSHGLEQWKIKEPKRVSSFSSTTSSKLKIGATLRVRN